MNSRNSGKARVRITTPLAAAALLAYVDSVGAPRRLIKDLRRLAKQTALDRPRKFRVRVSGPRNERNWLRATLLTAGRREPTENPDLLIPIEELDLPVRAYNCLKRAGINNVGELIANSELDLIDIPGFGAKSVDEVRLKLADLFQLCLKGDVMVLRATAAT